MRRLAILLPALALLGACGTAPTAPSKTLGPSLRAERDMAVRAGLRWLDAYLADEDNAAALGVDAVAIFADYAASSADEPSRQFALSAARRQAVRLEREFLAYERLTSGELLDLLLLLTQMHELGLNGEPLRSAAIRAIRRLPDPDHIYGLESLAAKDLDRLEENRIFALLLGVYAVERAAAAGHDFGIRFGLLELLPVVRRRPLIERAADPGPATELYRDHVYRATHIAYVLSDYGRLHQREGDAPEVFAYLARVFPDVLAAGDVELVAEIVDVWRSLGHDETNRALVRDGTVFLLGARNADGSWGPGDSHENAYLGAHHTWCAIMGLGERRFLSDTPYERRVRRAVDRWSGEPRIDPESTELRWFPLDALPEDMSRFHSPYLLDYRGSLKGDVGTPVLK